MKILFVLLLTFRSLISFSQTLTETDIKDLAEQINNKLKGADLGNGIIVSGCISFGRTLLYQYEVPDIWVAPENMKETLISNLKVAEYADLYFKNNINVTYQYFSEGRLLKQIAIKSYELSTLNFEIGEYINLKNNPKSKEVDFKIKQPLGWSVEDGDRPNVVIKFVYKTNTYLIMIKDNHTFLSRNETKKILEEPGIKEEYFKEIESALTNSEIIEQNIITLDTYPTLELKIRGNLERYGNNFTMIMKHWIIFYEDKIIFLQCAGLDGKEFQALESLYTAITNSVIFPEQYNN